MGKKLKIAVILMIAAALAVFGWYMIAGDGSKEKTPAPSERGTTEKITEKKVTKEKGGRRKKVRKERKKTNAKQDGKTAKKVRPTVKIDDVEKNFTAEEKQISEELQKSIDNDNVEDAITLAVAAASSKNPEIRKRAVEALGWFGKKAMAELTLFMNDADEDVSSDALHQWDLAMSEISSGPEKAQLIELGMRMVKDADALDSMIMEVCDLSNRLAMQTMLNVIESGSPEAKKVTMEHYEFFTGEEFTDRKAAEAWLAENPDDDDEAPPAPTPGAPAPAAK